MAIRNIANFAKALSDDGAYFHAWFHKTSGPTPVAGAWIDLSMGAGLPKYNAYVGSQNTATPLIGSANDGIFLGANSTGDRYINSTMVQATSNAFAPGCVMFMDYLMHYPLTDGDSTDAQDMDNTQTLPRYTTGGGVQCMAVCTTPMTADAICTVTYTNQNGVAGRTSSFRVVSTANVGTIVSAPDTSAAATRRSPFIPLDNGDTGIRSIQSAIMTTPSGGFFALVLVKPLTQVQMLELGVATEIYSIPQRACNAVKVLNGAYVNMVALVNNTGAVAPFRGCIEMAIQ